MNLEDGTVHWSRREFTGTALIDRPARRNALSAGLCEQLHILLKENTDLRALVIGGAGDRSFCSGADLAQRASDTGGISHGAGDRFRPAFERLLDEIVAYPAPVIAGVNGAALGAGMQLAVACDLRVASHTATFGIPAGRLGVVLSAVNVQRLAQAVGQPTARDILFTARTLDVNDATSIGFVQRRADNAVAEAEALGEAIAQLAPLSVQGHKTMLNRVATTSRLSGGDLRDLAELERVAFASADLQEGLAAFSEKRGPRFSGR
jgi:enoyl-CoA hydratase/carnithine racemase